MVKKSILLLSAIAALTSSAMAQKCATDDYLREMTAKYPQIAKTQEAMDMMWRGALSKTTATSYTQYFDSMYAAATAQKLVIPLVVHVMHDYGSDYIPDDTVYSMVKALNLAYSAKNADLADVIDVFKPYIGNPNFEFRLAQRDPLGNPTNGITRRWTQLTYGGDDQAKFDQWAPDRYYNIWLEHHIGRGAQGGIVLAYSTFPSQSASDPYVDGVIAGYQYTNDASHTIPHETGHYFSLYHTWNSSGGQAGQDCGDDEVDDTPPTKGHFSTCELYDTACATGYVKPYTYDSMGHKGSYIWDYPDTANTQNIMDYSSCTNMFTKQQVLRMRSAARSTVANRSNLWNDTNLIITGVYSTGAFVPNDLLPVPAFSVEAPSNSSVSARTYYMCADGSTQFIFKNRSWRDTITAVNWEFSNGATPGTSTEKTNTVKVAVTQPGWVTVKLTATGNHTGDSTISTAAVYAADPNYVINPMNGYVQEFNTSVNNDVDKYPMFNYYNNATRWSINNGTGYYDKTCIYYSNYDNRAVTQIGSPEGDKDDFFTPAFDLSAMTSGDCNLSFMYAGCYRTTDSKFMRDTLEVSYSKDCGETWHKVGIMTKGDISTIGSYQFPYMPQWQGEWKQYAFSVPSDARTSKTFFRFRYKPGVDYYAQGTGNNFYLDRINVSPFPAGINSLVSDNKTIAVAPNPTNSNAFVVIKSNGNNATAQVNVTDVTGKLVYSTQANLTTQVNRIEIPASAIAVKGLYMVQVTTGNTTQTEKLVAY